MERTLVTPPTFVIRGQGPSEDLMGAIQLLTGASNAPDSFVQESLDLYARQLLSTNSLELAIPAPFLPEGMPAARLKRLLPPSLSARIKFIDSFGTTWRAVQKYFAPIYADTAKIPKTSRDERHPTSNARELSSHVYSIALSIVAKAPAVVPPVAMAELLARLESATFGPESRARLAIINGVANCFERHGDIPALLCSPSIAPGLSNRIQEILEDAYLLEASRLRTFFSPGANWASLRRDLRIALDWVIRNRPWAQHAFRLGHQAVAVPSHLADLSQLVTGLGMREAAGVSPVLLDDTHNSWTGGNTVVQLKYPSTVAIFMPSADAV